MSDASSRGTISTGAAPTTAGLNTPSSSSQSTGTSTPGNDTAPVVLDEGREKKAFIADVQRRTEGGATTAATAPPQVVGGAAGAPAAFENIHAIPSIIPTKVLDDGLREVPHRFEQCEPDDLIALIASMLERLISHNDQIPLTTSNLTRFHSRAAPSISVADYLVRITRYTNVSPSVLLLLIPYVDRICARQPTFTISSLTVHRFLIAGVAVGSKALSDSFCTNGRYAKVGGVSLTEMNLLEKEFCHAIDWRLTITGTVLSHYYTSLVRSHPEYRLAEPIETVPVAREDSPPSSSPVAADQPLTPASDAVGSTSADTLDTPSSDSMESEVVSEEMEGVSSSTISLSSNSNETGTAGSDMDEDEDEPARDDEDDEDDDDLQSEKVERMEDYGSHRGSRVGSADPVSRPDTMEPG